MFLKIYLGISAFYMVWGFFVLEEDMVNSRSQGIALTALIITAFLWPVVILRTLWSKL